ncbi:hypothetical protein Ancab_009296 [Ancistrocladus abbreviatus]
MWRNLEINSHAVTQIGNPEDKTELEKEIAALEAENTAGSRLLELRIKQFALLLHVVCANSRHTLFLHLSFSSRVDASQASMEEDQKSWAEEMRIAADEHESTAEDVNWERRNNGVLIRVLNWGLILNVAHKTCL